MSAGPSDAALAARYGPILRDELAALQEASRETSADRAPVTLDQQSVGRLSRMDALQGQAMAAAVEARRGQRRRIVLAALQRMEEGEFGFCATCGGFIGSARLDVDPAAALCVECAAGG